MAVKIVVITGPSGVGKSTVLDCLLKRHHDWRQVRSFTTRTPRPGEDKSGKYIFITEDEFLKRQKAGEMFEHEKYAGNLYGLSRKSLEEATKSDTVSLILVEPNGALTIKKELPQTIDIFLYASSIELYSRLQKDRERQTVSATEKNLRLKLIDKINSQIQLFTHVVPSPTGQIEKIVTAIEAIIATKQPNE